LSGPVQPPAAALASESKVCVLAQPKLADAANMELAATASVNLKVRFMKRFSTKLPNGGTSQVFL
jgi:hypothetical protein